MIPRSAPILMMFATANNDTAANKSLLEWYFLMTPDKPLPDAIPILPHISWMATIAGHKNTASQASLYPYWAPAMEYVAIPDGSSSAAPVTNPGPIFLKILWFFRAFLDFGGVISGQIGMGLSDGGRRPGRIPRPQALLVPRQGMRVPSPALDPHPASFFRESRILVTSPSWLQIWNETRMQLAPPSVTVRTLILSWARCSLTFG